MLGAIFAFQAGIFGLGLFWCARGGGLKSCPKIGERYEATFNVMIATTLALLTGAGLQAMSQRQSSSGDPGGVSLPAPPQLPPEGHDHRGGRGSLSDRSHRRRARGSCWRLGLLLAGFPQRHFNQAATNADKFFAVAH